MSADVSARLAWPEDAVAIAHVQLAAWHDSFADLLGEDNLAQLDAGAIAESWNLALTKPQDARMRVLVALERATVRGFTLVHPCFDPDADQVSDGEIGEFVVHPDHRRLGHGSRLLQAAIDTLSADGFTRAVWWVNSADDALREFVTTSGWEADGAHRQLEAVTGAELRQVRLHTALT